jgi:hypothetical protein
MRFSIVRVLIWTTALSILASGASCLDATLSGSGMNGVKDILNADIDESIYSTSVVSYEPAGVRMVGYRSGFGILNEHNYVTSGTGEYAAVHAYADNAAYYIYKWDYLPGNSRIIAWEDLAVYGGSNIALSAEASNSRGDYASVSTTVDDGSIAYHSIGAADKNSAVAAQTVDYASGGSLLMGWNAIDGYQDRANGYALIKDGSISSPSTGFARAAGYSSKAGLDLNDAQGRGYNIFVEASNWLYGYQAERSGGKFERLSSDITNTATPVKLQAKIKNRK